MSVLFAVAIVGVFVTPAWANGATALMLAGVGHLFIGNAALGVVEGALVAAWAHQRRGIAASMLLMVLANYASAWAALLYFPAAEWALRSTVFRGELLDTAWPMFWAMFLVAFVATVLIEWPFIWARMAFKRPMLWRTLAVSAVLNCITYPLLAGWYLLFSTTTLFTGADRDDSLSIVPESADAWVFFIAPDDSVRRVSVRGGEPVIVQTPDKSRPVTLYSLKRDDGGFDLLLESWHDDLTSRVLIREFAERASTDQWKGDWLRLSGYAKAGYPAAASDLRPESERSFKAVGSEWALRVSGLRPGVGSHALGFETLQVALHISNATAIPGDLVVFEIFGRDAVSSGHWICIYSPARRTWGVLAKGRSPIVAIGLRDPLPHPAAPADGSAPPSP